MRYVFAAAVAVALLASIARAGTPEPGYTDTLAAAGLSNPTALAFMPDGRMLVTEKGGDLVLVDGGVPSTLVTIPVCSASEMGLLGIALDPDFTNNGFIYLYRTKRGSIPPCSGTGRVNEVVRVTMALDDTVSIGTLVVLLTGMRTDNGNHDGGVLRIGPDDKLYVGVGDTGLGDNQGGPGSSTNPYAQDFNSLEGKVLRLELDGSVPLDNPFVGQASTSEEIFALGFRNPFRMSFDPDTGSLWLGDVGDLTFEEIDIVTAGGNYSWEYCEGNAPVSCAMPGDVAPIFVYPHSGGSSLGVCVIGGSFAGAAFGSLAGDYVFGDCGPNPNNPPGEGTSVYRAALTPARDDIAGTPVRISKATQTPADFVTGPDGAVYYASVGGGQIRRLAQAIADKPLAGSKLLLKTSPPDDTRKQLKLTSKDTSVDLGLGNGSLADPVLHGGTLRIFTASGDAFDATYSLPVGASWSYLGDAGDNRGYRYRDKALANGPVKVFILRPGKLIKVTGKGDQLGHTLAANPDPVSAVLTLGDSVDGQVYCLEFGGGAFETDRSYATKETAAPGACPP